MVHQRFPQGSTIKKTNHRVKSSNTSRSGRGKCSGRGGRGDRGGHGGRGRGGNHNYGRRNNNWDITGLDGKKIHVHPAYQFNNDQWFNIPEKTRQQFVQLRREYRNRERSRDGDHDQGGQSRMLAQGTRQVSQSYLHYGPVPGTVYQLPPPPAGGIPVPPGWQSDISQATWYRCNQDDLSDMTGNNRGHATHGSLMGGWNEQADLRSHNSKNRGISNVITRSQVGCAAAAIEPDPNMSAQNEADTNADTCCLGQNFILLCYTNRSADVYPYSDAYAPIENVPIITAATAFDHLDGNTYFLVFYESTKMKHSLINPN